MTREHVIYGLIDPRTDELRYVGRSVNGLRRARAHVTPSGLRLEDHCHRWVRGLIAEGLEPDAFVIESWDGGGDPEEWLDESERHHIAYFRSIGCRLTNLTDGGHHRGLSGYRFDPEVAAARGKKVSEKLKGRPQRNGFGAKVSASHARKKHPTTFKPGHKPWHAGKTGVISLETREKMSLAKRGKTGKPHSPETKARMARAKMKPVVCTTDGLRFESVDSAAAHYGIGSGSIARVARGVRKHTRGLHFEFIKGNQ